MKDDTRPNLVVTGNRKDGLMGSKSSRMLRFLGRYAENIDQAAVLDTLCRGNADKYWDFNDSRHEMAKSMSWYRITLSRQEYESGEVTMLLGVFRAAYIARNGPKGMAMFGCWSDDETCYFVYTTPRSVRHIEPLLDAYSAKQVDSPEPSCLSLLFGDESGLSSSEIGFEA